MNQSISVLCNCRFPSTAAHGVYLARLCESFAENGAEVELVVPKRFREVRADPMSYYSVKTPFRVRKIRSFDFLIFGRFLGKLAFMLQYLNFYFFVLPFFLFRSRKRVIYTMDSFGCFLFFLGYPVVFETHVGIGSYRKRLLSLLKRASKIVALNSIIKKEFIAAGFQPEEIMVAPNGVDLSAFAGSELKEELRQFLNLPMERKIVAYVGKYKTMGMDKGVNDLVRAFSFLRKTKPDAFLLIVGLVEDEKIELSAFLTREGEREEDFRIVEHVSQTKVARFMKAADALVMNYPGTEYYRNYMSPMKMFEYMASGNPIVASDLPSVREILNDSNAMLVRPDDTEALSDAITRLFEDGRLAARLAAQARTDVSERTWKNRGKKILDFIKNDNGHHCRAARQ